MNDSTIQRINESTDTARHLIEEPRRLLHPGIRADHARIPCALFRLPQILAHHAEISERVRILRILLQRLQQLRLCVLPPPHQHLHAGQAVVQLGRPRKPISELLNRVIGVLKTLSTLPRPNPRVRQLRQRRVVVDFTHLAGIPLCHVQPVHAQADLYRHSQILQTASQETRLQSPLRIPALQQHRGGRHHCRLVAAHARILHPRLDLVHVPRQVADVPRLSILCEQRQQPHRLQARMPLALADLVQHDLAAANVDVGPVRQNLAGYFRLLIQSRHLRCLGYARLWRSQMEGIPSGVERVAS
mmetsp:Transcript_4564/g.12929  ORF Transcript_4564/g.12929 Transcript_4564/m.12929 type:complete len:302 (+) Transcript_4564:1480-2385(+)